MKHEHTCKPIVCKCCNLHWCKLACKACGIEDCYHGDIYHYNPDGCPTCKEVDATVAASEAKTSEPGVDK